MSDTVTLTIVPGSPQRVDESCTGCSLPSVVEVPLKSVTEEGVSLSLGSVRVCLECGKQAK